MAAPTKEMKFCKELFEITLNEGNYHFERLEGNEPGYVVDTEKYPTLKDACAFVKQCEDLKDGGASVESTKTLRDSVSAGITLKDDETPSAGSVIIHDHESVIRRKSLAECAAKFPTDKITHGYIPIYEEHLPQNIGSLLEIGCWKGNSLRMWREFLPDAALYTLDLFEENKEPKDIENLVCFKGNQSEPEVLQHVVDSNTYDVVIDDGSHGSIDQWSVVEAFCKPGTVVVIEDLHCCEEAFWRQGLEFDQTILGQMRAGTFPFKHKLFEVKKGSIMAFIYAD